MGIRIKITLTILTFFLSFSYVEAGTLSKPANNLGLVGYWSFNEGTSTVATDFSGRGNHGTLNTFSAPATASSGWGNGKLAGGLTFDGSSDYVEIMSTTNPTAYTFAMWIKPSVVSTQNIWTRTSSSGPLANWSHQLRINSSGIIEHYIYGGSLAAGTTVLLPNTWYHIVGTAINGGDIKIYVNGVSEGTPGSLGSMWTDGDRYHLGNASTGFSYFNGIVDDVRVYSRVLSDSEIKSLYNTGVLKINGSQNNVLTKGLVGMWSFDGGDIIDKVYDRSGQGNHGYFYNGATSTAKTIGKLGQALTFDGSDDYVNLGSPTSLDDIGVITISAWIYPRSFGESHLGRIYEKSSGSGGKNFFVCGSSAGGICGSSNRIRFIQDYSSVDGSWYSGASSISLNQWQHVVVIYDSTSLEYDPIFYINGSISATTEAVTPSGSIISDASGIAYIGNADSGGTRTFDGHIDDVRVYNRALSASEVKTLYNMGGSKINTSTASPTGTTLGSGLVGYWSFNGPDITDRVYDRSGQGNNGYFYNGATSSAKTIGKMGQALTFDGTDDWVDVPESSSLKPTSMSYGGWVKFSDVSTVTRSIISTANTSGYAFMMRTNGVGGCNNATSLCASIYVGGSYHSIYYSSSNFSNNVWYHIFATYDGETYLMYVNGVEVGSNSSMSGPITYTTNRFCIAGESQGSNCAQLSGFPGSIDEVRVYNRALSASEIKMLYNLGR